METVLKINDGEGPDAADRQTDPDVIFVSNVTIDFGDIVAGLANLTEETAGKLPSLPEFFPTATERPPTADSPPDDETTAPTIVKPPLSKPGSGAEVVGGGGPDVCDVAKAIWSLTSVIFIWPLKVRSKVVKK